MSFTWASRAHVGKGTFFIISMCLLVKIHNIWPKMFWPFFGLNHSIAQTGFSGLYSLAFVLPWIMQSLDDYQITKKCQIHHWQCYETIMFGQVTHTLDAAANPVRSFVWHHSHSVTSPPVVLWQWKIILYVVPLPVFHWQSGCYD